MDFKERDERIHQPVKIARDQGDERGAARGHDRHLGSCGYNRFRHAATWFKENHTYIIEISQCGLDLGIDVVPAQTAKTAAEWWNRD